MIYFFLMEIATIPPIIEGLIFDIDLTLYDNREYYESQKRLLLEKLARITGRSYEETLEAADEYQTGYMKANNGKKLSMGNLFLLGFGISIEENCRWRSSLFNPEAYLRLDRRLVHTMKRLSERFQCAAVTNNTRIIGERTLRVLGIDSFFRVIIGLDQTLVSKPSMKPFYRAAEKIGVPPERCISIGDRFEVDVELPVREGMGGILVESMEDVYRLPDLLMKESQTR
ncbi:MAG: HAD family hydrolase [Spirochaetales bacterium]|nr:HAD family hydrolase [Spirochaetales bacterium]